MDFEDLLDHRGETIRTLEVGNNKMNFKRTDPYGFWHISYERGAVPAELSGAYTTYEQAERAAQQYLAKKGRVATEK